MFRWKWNNSCLDFTCQVLYNPRLCVSTLLTITICDLLTGNASKNVKFMDILFKAFENSFTFEYMLVKIHIF